MQTVSGNTRNFFPVLAGVVTASIILAATWLFYVNELERHVQDERIRTLHQMSAVRARLEGTLNSRLLLVRSIVSFVSIHGNIDHKTFQSFAEGLIAGDPLIRNVSLLKDTVIVHIYPLKGQEKAVGVDLAAIPEQRDTVRRAMETKHAVIAGPIDLVQGGKGIVGRIPIFLTPNGEPLGRGAYWGQASVVIMQDALFKEVGILDPSSDLTYALRGKDGLAANGALFWGDETLFKEDPVVTEVALPGGAWQMATMPRAGWGSHAVSYLWFVVVGGGLAIAAGWMMWLLSATKETLQQRLSLQQSLMGRAKESEIRYRTLFESAHDAMFIIKGDEFVDCNKASLAVFGRRREQMLGAKPYAFSPPTQPDGRISKDKALEKIASALSGRPQFFEWRHCRYDGTRFDAEVSLSGVEVNGEYMVHATVRDVTDRKSAEKALLESEERYRSVLESSPNPIVVYDREGLVTYVNPSFVATFGWTEHELLGQRIDYVPIEEPPEPAPTLFDAGNGGPSLETRRLTKQGKVLDVIISAALMRDHSGKSVGSVVTLLDMTQRKVVENALKSSEEANRLLIEGSPIGITIVQDEKYAYVNGAHAAMLGSNSPQEIVGESSLAFVAPEDRDSLQKEIGKQTTALHGPSNYQVKGVKKNGEPFDAKVWTHAAHYLGKPATFSFVVDVTEENRLKAQLVQSQKMEAIGTLAGGIAHDFNNILFAIRGYTEMALEGTTRGSQLRSDLERVLDAANRAGDMVKQILTFSRQTQPERKPLHLGSIVKEGLKFLRASIPSTIELRQRIEPNAAKIFGDPTQIHQVLMNFCANAAHAMRDTKGVLSVDVSTVDVGSSFTVEHQPMAEGKYVRLTVEDTGHGIPPETLNRIFDPYFTTKKPGEGTGLGLSVVHGIVKSHGGTVTVSGEPGKGAVFSAFFPVIEEDVIMEDEPRTDYAPGGNERILFLDDEDMLVDMGKEMLERLGYEVVPKTSSVEALELFRSDPFRFDLVITDRIMPKMTGDELAGELSAIRPEIPIVVCTGFGQELTQEDAKALGIGALLMKPISRKDIALTIRRLLDQAREMKNG